MNVIAPSGPDLFVGGAFLAAGSDRSIHHFARWDGTQWSSVGPLLSLVNGKFNLSLMNQNGRPYSIEASTDLLYWRRVTTFTNGTSVMPFIDPESDRLERRFYRAVSE